jgi:hypothetical protein
MKKSIIITALIALTTGCATVGYDNQANRVSYSSNMNYRISNIGGLPVTSSLGIGIGQNGVRITPNIGIDLPSIYLK